MKKKTQEKIYIKNKKTEKKDTNVTNVIYFIN